MREKEIDPGNRFDAVVVGAGLAGLSAARALHEAGRSVLVLEGRDRIGGRVYSRPLLGTHYIYNVGAASIAPEWHLNIAAEIKRYNLQLNDSAYALDSYTACLGLGRYFSPISKWRFSILLWRSRKKWVAPMARLTPAMPLALLFFLGVPLRFGNEIKILAKYLLSKSRRIKTFAGFDQPGLAEFDIPFEEAISSLGLSTGVRDFTFAAMSQILAGSPKNITLLNALQIIAMLDSNPLAFFAWDRDFVGGNRSLPYAIAQDVPNIRLNAAVKSILQNADGVRVVLRDGTVFSGNRCVVACPLATWHMIDFSPALSSAKQEVANPLRWPARRAIAIVENLAHNSFGFGYGKGGGIFSYAVAEQISPELSIVDMVALPGAIDFNDLKGVETALQRYYPGVRVIRVDDPKWPDQEFTQQAWNINYAPGQLTRNAALAAKFEGKLHFCNSDLATGWIGWQDGALEAGKRAGAECVDALLSR